MVLRPAPLLLVLPIVAFVCQAHVVRREARTAPSTAEKGEENIAAGDDQNVDVEVQALDQEVQSSQGKSSESAAQTGVESPAEDEDSSDLEGSAGSASEDDVTVGRDEVASGKSAPVEEATGAADESDLESQAIVDSEELGDSSHEDHDKGEDNGELPIDPKEQAEEDMENIPDGPGPVSLLQASEAEKEAGEEPEQAGEAPEATSEMPDGTITPGLPDPNYVEGQEDTVPEDDLAEEPITAEQRAEMDTVLAELEADEEDEEDDEDEDEDDEDDEHSRGAALEEEEDEDEDEDENDDDEETTLGQDDNVSETNSTTIGDNTTAKATSASEKNTTILNMNATAGKSTAISNSTGQKDAGGGTTSSK